MTYLIDTHAHLDDNRLSKNVDSLISEAKKKGVNRIINIGISIESSKKTIELAKKYDDIYAAVGIHPHDAKNAPEGYIDSLEKMSQEEKVVAIGEMGLDYFKNISPKDTQIKVFKEQLSLAKELNMPVVIHDRDAHQDMINILKDFNGIKGVFHCFSGDWSVASELLKMGYYVSFTGTITFKKAEKLREVVRRAPMDRIMVETDCPYLAPEPFRGKLNQPAYARLVGEAVAEEKDLHLDKVAEITTQNAINFFDGLS
ncbi:TatD family hydrolase [Natranaerofaba carboxydovora]|uniref:TatD family hydrolase n=1 Tax=Natranaerofaba carboxydovora TaxID=2742683 RepID=UPI001F14004F|nr:TatD family hydrolase [Natranaerofaba carboxydovora]UMZ75248.1 D-aminoacyl-tRNA deacylase [Natranaerofaba carboxydovora]